MRVIAGTYRSRPLAAPRGHDTRPTSDRLRETLFNVLAQRIEGASFVDLYAGSGAVGIEALSRGARHVCFAENAPAALAAIRANLAALKIDGGFHIESGGVLAALHSATEAAGVRPWDLVFLDPPYQDAAARAETLGRLGRNAGSLLSTEAIVVVEHRSGRHRAPKIARSPLQPGSGGTRMAGKDQPEGLEDPAPSYGALERYRVIEQGDAALSFYALRAAI
jgi:16S rRNA (guanine(966)-N(2))-methyltransferase RsmD